MTKNFKSLVYKLNLLLFVDVDFSFKVITLRLLLSLLLMNLMRNVSLNITYVLLRKLISYFFLKKFYVFSQLKAFAEPIVINANCVMQYSLSITVASTS